MGRWRLANILVPAGLCALLIGAEQAKIPRRIVAIGPNTAEVVCALGACDRLVGVSRFCVFPPELKTLPQVGGFSDPDLEKIATLRPDMLMLRGRMDSLERLAQQLGIPVYHDQTDTLGGIERCVKELGTVLGTADRAEEVVGKFHRELQQIRNRVAGRSKPRVFLSVSRDPDRIANLLTAGRGSFLSEMLEVAGGINVFGELDMAYPQVSPEAILARQPEVILELMPEVELTPGLEGRLLEQWRGLGTLPAVREGRVHIMTDENCLIPSPRYTEIISEVADLLHPGAKAVGE